jgi:hypothetical protein
VRCTSCTPPPPSPPLSEILGHVQCRARTDTTRPRILPVRCLHSPTGHVANKPPMPPPTPAEQRGRGQEWGQSPASCTTATHQLRHSLEPALDGAGRRMTPVLQPPATKPATQVNNHGMGRCVFTACSV